MPNFGECIWYTNWSGSVREIALFYKVYNLADRYRHLSCALSDSHDLIQVLHGSGWKYGGTFHAPESGAQKALFMGSFFLKKYCEGCQMCPLSWGHYHTLR